ncbi:LIRB3 protein, partial [Crocuta crocuta]
SGTLPTPTIWAEPGSVVPWGTPVTIWCQGTLESTVFYLDKEEHVGLWDVHFPKKPGDKAKFSITHMRDVYAGRYHCHYRSPSGLSESSDPLELVVTGSRGKPSLSALPSPVVTSGGKVTLQCASWEKFDRFILMKEGEPRPSSTLDSQRPTSGEFQARFPVGPVTPGLRWTFRCYGYYSNSPQVWSQPSEPLDLLVSGFYRKPSLSALPSPVVTSGVNVTLQCASWEKFDRFVLMKEGEPRPSSTLDSQRHTRGQFQALFPVGPMTPGLRWTFRCYGYYSNTPQMWSLSSDPLELLISGVYPAPSLSAIPGPVVASGGNVSLSCSSQIPRQTFRLLKEGVADVPRHLELKFPRETRQALFPVGPVSPSHGGTYRCYVSPASYPYTWSLPSEPLHLQVTG